MFAVEEKPTDKNCHAFRLGYELHLILGVIMHSPRSNLLIFYVESPQKSEAFYTQFLNIKPVHRSQTFVLFNLTPGNKLGLWSKDDVSPAADSASECMELALELPTRDAVEQSYQLFLSQGTPIKQPPTELSFGYAFTVCDPDGHRLRFYHLENQV